MGIDLYCSEKSFCCSYSGWNSFRNEVIIATYDYLKNHFSLNPLDDDKESNEKVYRKEISDFFELILNVKKNYINNVFDFSITSPIDELIKYGDLKSVDLLIYYGIGGLYSFCNKSDCEGYYSVGNSYDICELFNLIKPFLIKNKENNELYNNVIKEIEEIFKESVEKKLVVTIC